MPSINSIGAARRQRDVAFADGAQIVFEMMGELLCRPQLDHSGDGFERVEAAEEVVDRSGLGRRAAAHLFERRSASAPPSGARRDSAK